MIFTWARFREISRRSIETRLTHFTVSTTRISSTSQTISKIITIICQSITKAGWQVFVGFLFHWMWWRRRKKKEGVITSANSRRRIFKIIATINTLISIKIREWGNRIAWNATKQSISNTISASWRTFWLVFFFFF